MAFFPKARWLVIGICALACVGVAAWGWHLYTGHTHGGLVLFGNVDIRQVDLGFRVGGRIESVLVDEGDTVAAGEPLARLDADILRQQRDQAAARLAGQKADLARLERGYRAEEVAQARAQVAAARAVAENAAINLQRVTAMRQSNAISQKELDNARAADREAAARLRSNEDQLDMLLSGYREEDVLAQRAAVAAAEAGLRRAEIDLADGVLRAPQKGVILTRAREAGAIVQPGQTVYTLTLTEPVWLRAYVDEPNLGRIRPGMPVRVAVDAAPGKTFPGTVGFISPTAEFTPKTVETREVRTALVYRLRVRAEDPENVMRQGMPVTIFVDTAAP
ncbi:MAG: secretion protein HlyD [Desulfovibrio sp.]|uniref:secretion protein HlyD n=1 Tax=Desulfovibrio sp. TaxID=885 RepID=UPI001A7BF0DF|nr:secretion protein HlyD [Desulfovibrio sp.]MBD5416206.1 secretion protein HlyD [Desulfovibrio sp.]